MNTATHQTPPSGVNTRQLWAAVAVLGITVIALGASLVHIQTRPIDGHMALAALDPPTTSAQEKSSAAEPTSPLPVTTVGKGETVLTTPAPPQTTKTVAPAAVYKSLPQPVPQPPAKAAAAPSVSAPPVLPVPAAVVIGTQANAPLVKIEAGLLASRPITTPLRAVCADCGRVESVRAVERRGEAQGVGAVAGNTIERSSARTIIYEVQVRMEDGGLRTVVLPSAPAIGSAVVVERQLTRLPNGSVPLPLPLRQDNAPAPAFMPQPKVYNSERY